MLPNLMDESRCVGGRPFSANDEESLLSCRYEGSGVYMRKREITRRFVYLDIIVIR